MRTAVKQAHFTTHAVSNKVRAQEKPLANPSRQRDNGAVVCAVIPASKLTLLLARQRDTTRRRMPAAQPSFHPQPPAAGRRCAPARLPRRPLLAPRRTS